jgi:uncharacterized protein YndB with AHSA1/START domain
MTSGLVVGIERVLCAPRPVVYGALTVPEQIAKWWGPVGFTAPRVDFVPRVGRGYRIAMQPPDGDVFYLSGEFHEVQPPSRLAYTFRWTPPDPDDRETLVTLSLEQLDQATKVVLSHAGFATEPRRVLHHRGWADCLARLAQLIEPFGDDRRYIG